MSATDDQAARARRRSVAYYAATANRPPDPRLVRAADLVGAPGRALDLGAGAGAAARYLLGRGFHVTAVDGDPAARGPLTELPDQHRLEIVIARFEDFEPARYDLVHSSLSLMFLSRRSFGRVWPRLLSALNPGGALAVNLFGDRDEWNDRTGPADDDDDGWPLDGGGTFLSGVELEALLGGLEIVSIADEERDLRMVTGGVRRKHLLGAIARRPA